MTSQDVILGLLSKRSLSGYEIKNLFLNLLSYFYDASYGTIYPTLGKMDQNGLITKESVVQEGKPNKHVYTITEKGREKFRAYLHSELHPNVLRSDFMMRLYYGEHAEPELSLRWLEESRRIMGDIQEQLHKDYEAFSSKLSPTQEICIKLGIASVGSQLQVLNENIKKMKKQME